MDNINLKLNIEAISNINSTGQNKLNIENTEYCQKKITPEMIIKNESIYKFVTLILSYGDTNYQQGSGTFIDTNIVLTCAHLFFYPRTNKIDLLRGFTNSQHFTMPKKGLYKIVYQQYYDILYNKNIQKTSVDNQEVNQFIHTCPPNSSSYCIIDYRDDRLPDADEMSYLFPVPTADDCRDWLCDNDAYNWYFFDNGICYVNSSQPDAYLEPLTSQQSYGGKIKCESPFDMCLIVTEHIDETHFPRVKSSSITFPTSFIGYPNPGKDMCQYFINTPTSALSNSKIFNTYFTETVTPIAPIGYSGGPCITENKDIVSVVSQKLGLNIATCALLEGYMYLEKVAYFIDSYHELKEKSEDRIENFNDDVGQVQELIKEQLNQYVDESINLDRFPGYTNAIYIQQDETQSILYSFVRSGTFDKWQNNNILESSGDRPNQNSVNLISNYLYEVVNDINDFTKQIDSLNKCFNFRFSNNIDIPVDPIANINKGFTSYSIYYNNIEDCEDDNLSKQLFSYPKFCIEEQFECI